MTDRTETLVREALQRQADRAPSAAAVLARLEVRQTRGRPRRSVLVGVTAAVVALLAVGAVLIAGPKGPGDQATPAAEQAQRSAAPAPHGTLMKWDPHWLPAGMTEKTRSLAANGTLRIWTATPVDQTGNTKGPEVSIMEDHTATGGGGPVDPAHKVSINGMTGSLMWDPRSKDAIVDWTPEPGVGLSVRVMRLTDGADIALQVARSVLPDGKSRFNSPISFANLPKEWGPTAVVRVYGNSPREAQTEVTMNRNIPKIKNSEMTLYAFTLLPGKPIPTPVDGASEPAVQVTPAPGVTVVLRPDLLPSHNRSIDNKADVARISKLIVVDPHADVSWIGTP